MKFLLLCLGYTISLLIFQAGFLLKRKEIHIRSTCRDAPTGSNNCWMKPQYNKVILMIVDALRHDFILPQSDTNIAPYLNQMKFAASLANSSILSSIIADPPTTTLQRLKGITTGTLPTFIDVSDNFSPNANINEDNIIDQLISKGLNATLIGDDTWVSLYPDRFHRSYPMSSFDVHDLHGVDDGILKVLPEELARTDTQFLILHFLGVDHCGHRYGPDHPEMAKKLRQMDTTIEYIVKRMRQDELLVVMGDHGMTTTGDHGGEAFAEITAGLLIHSPSTAFQTPTLPPRQIDLLPSLSLLLGLPIPFSNLGNVIPELFPVELQRKLAVQLNYEQVIRFARTYSSSNALSLSEFSLFDDRDLDENDQLKTLQRIQQALRAAWTQFDTTIIIVGLVSIAECILYNLSDEPSSFTQWIVRSGLLLLQFSAFFGGSENPSVPLLLGTLVILSIFHLLRIIKLATLIRSRSKMMTNLLFTILPCLCFFSNSFIVRETDVLRFFLQTLVILSLAIKTSSWKKKLGGGKMNVKILRQLVFSDEALIPILMIALLRLAPFFHRCREEEINCVQYFPTILSASLPGDIRVMRLLLSIFSSSTLSYLIGQRAHWLLGNFFGDTISTKKI
ncbi:unnamed protein product, partial [Mesorhabditis belari]|uniref:GPI ethanolamine phosphate transferase 3 n=1 Tax=Mesorhabditis belari TaxID=2138241 RepID=A0AAF3F542_9BILA